jgi:hypothetical protein
MPDHKFRTGQLVHSQHRNLADTFVQTILHNVVRSNGEPDVNRRKQNSGAAVL